MKTHDARFSVSIDLLTAPIKRRLALLALIISLGAPAFADGDSNGKVKGPRQLTWQGAAAGIQRLEIRAGNGTAKVRAIEGDEIRVRVSLRPKRNLDGKTFRRAFRWFLASGYDDADQLSQAVDLQVKRRNGELVIQPLPHGRSRKSAIVETWEIDVPMRLGLQVHMDSAEIEVSGLEGGVVLRLGHGEAKVDVPRGDLDLEVTVGNIEAQLRQTDLGELRLASEVGDTRLWLDGRRVKHPKPPGPGSHIKIEGDGPDEVHVRVTVGDAKLTVN